jgi:hypothetical protein
VNSPVASFGTSRDRPATVSFAEIETAARKLMASGDYPSVAAVRQQLKRGSTTTIADAMRRFWKDQAALNSGNPIALTRLPPELAESAQALWEQALRLAQQTVQIEDSAARARLAELSRDVDARARSIELREKEWDMAARVRERALADTREQVNVLLRELAIANSEWRASVKRIVDLESQIEDYRAQMKKIITQAIARNRRAGTGRIKRTSRAAPILAKRNKASGPRRSRVEQRRKGKRR